MNVDNDYKETKECSYKNENYLVRDNGAILRKSIDGKRERPLDNKWTFGTYNEKQGYSLINGVPVHRIVATAFLGEPKKENMVVDHIDTNRRNNRPSNLRWVTKLENILLNPITCKRIEFQCGVDIFTFLKNPEKYRNRLINTNYEWMRAVTKEEANNCLDNLKDLMSQTNKAVSKGNGFGDWIFSKKEVTIIKVNANYNTNDNSNSEEDNIKTENILEQSNVERRNWSTPTEFINCPKFDQEQTLELYFNNMEINSVFSKNKFGENKVLNKAFSINKDSIIVMTDFSSIKPFGIVKITYENGKFVHEAVKSCFTEDGANKYFTIEQGLEWNGPDSIDDYC